MDIVLIMCRSQPPARRDTAVNAYHFYGSCDHFQFFLSKPRVLRNLRQLAPIASDNSRQASYIRGKHPMTVGSFITPADALSQAPKNSLICKIYHELPTTICKIYHKLSTTICKIYHELSTTIFNKFL